MLSVCIGNAMYVQKQNIHFFKLFCLEYVAGSWLHRLARFFLQ